jgi:hypothetical protein
MDWILLAWDKDVAGFCEHDNEPLLFHKMRGISWPAEDMLSFMKASVSHSQSVI